jgi:hypothetical protein
MPSGTPDGPPGDTPPTSNPAPAPEPQEREPGRDDEGDETERGAATVMEELGDAFNESITGDDAGPARPADV